MATQAKPRFAKYIKVSDTNNNKFFELSWDGVSPNLVTKYGRIEASTKTGSYPISDWDKVCNDRIKHGYKEVTAYVTTDLVDQGAPSSLAKVGEAKVEEFLSLMKAYTDGLVAKTYSVKATSVTQAQVDAAQKWIDHLNRLDPKVPNFEKEANKVLLELYTVIPRRMSKTQDYLIPSIQLKDILQDEQDKLDALSSQVAQLAPKKTRKVSKKAQTLLDVLGISMKVGAPNPKIQYLVDQLKSYKVAAIFEIDKPAENEVFTKWLAKQKNQTTRIVIHGTQPSSVNPILEVGLKIRPTGNFQYSGKIYGSGNYYSETCIKSLGYTGYHADQVLLIYEVHTGNPYIYNGRFNGNTFPLNYRELSSRGFDSTFVKAGNGLLNSELIAYKEEQCRIIGAIWIKR